MLILCAFSERQRSPPPVSRPRHAPSDPEPTNVVGVFGLSVRTTEVDLEEEFGKVSPVEKVVIVYDARVSLIRFRVMSAWSSM
jgi:transformer-2 protein